MLSKRNIYRWLVLNDYNYESVVKNFIYTNNYSSFFLDDQMCGACHRKIIVKGIH